jgi:DNA-binding winged helix-turn-helix (wHTH) protein
MAETRGEVVSSQQLLDSVWPGVVVGSASVYQDISALRKILGDSEATPTYIATVLRKGYRLLAALEPVANVATDAAAPAELKPAATLILGGGAWRSRLTIGRKGEVPKRP